MTRHNKSRGLHRRSMLRGMLGGATVAVGLPMLEIFLNESGTAYADGGAFPRRYVQFFWGNGVLPWFWTPSTTGTDYELTEQLAPLESVRNDMTVVSGFDVKTTGRIPHHSARTGFFSCAPLEVMGEVERWQAPSLDQLLAAELGGETRFRSLQTAALSNAGSLSVSAAGQHLPSESSPAALFERLFGAGFRLPGETAVIDPTLALRRSVLDAVMTQQRRLLPRLGAEDRRRMDQHLSNVRELELRIARLEDEPPNYEACALPDMPPTSFADDERGRPDVDAVNVAMSGLLAMALACDQTRVVSHVLSPSVADAVFPIDGIELDGVLRGHHDLTHNEPLDDGSGRGEMWRTNEVVKYITGTLSRFVEAFRAIPEGDGSLLDNSIVLASTDASNPRLHSLDDFPILLFGRGCGRMQTGFHYRSEGDNAARVNLTIARAMGLPLADIGQEEGFVTDSVAELEA